MLINTTTHTTHEDSIVDLERSVIGLGLLADLLDAAGQNHKVDAMAMGCLLQTHAKELSDALRPLLP